MLVIKIVVLLAVISSAVGFTVSSVRLQSAPYRTLRFINREIAKRSLSHLNQYAGLDTLGGMGLGKRSETEQAGEKRALSTFDSLGGMGLGKRSSSPVFIYEKRAGHPLPSLDTLAGMGFGKRR
uniref:Neuropeptide-Like Protein n=1 Tax=Caenorhabditis tropicalis TaxID=1561998 RepID=A0A1I7UR14_9PELO